MNKDIVIFDIATTGLEVLQDDIIEFAALRLRDDEILECCHFLILPEQELTAEALTLTGLKQEEFAGVSALQAHTGEIQELFADAVLVGHRANILLSILAGKLGVYFQQTLWDTLELARIFFPTMQDFQLPYLAEKLSLAGAEEYIGRRSEVNVRLIRKLLEACRDKSLAFDLSFFNQTKNLLEGWPGRSFIDETAKEITRRFPDRQIRTDFVLASTTSEEGLFAKGKTSAKTSSDVSVPLEWVIACFSPGGTLEQNLNGYESRPGQVMMAKRVAEGLSSSEHVVVEAGTGTGKSFAYLIPCLWSANRTKKKVVVATHTIPLQEQLYKKDIPLLKTVLPFSFKVSVLKGKGNYCCLRKMQSYVANPEIARLEQKLALLGILVWLRETQTGDMQELARIPGLRQIWPSLNADNEACIPAKCSQAGPCFLLRARKKAEEADLLIVNHSLLFSDIKTDNNVLPEYHQLVIDEAHQVYQTALQHLGSDLSLENVARLMDSVQRMTDQNAYGGLKQRWGYSQQGASVSWEIFEDCLKQIPESCKLVLEQARELFQSLALILGGERTFRFVAGHLQQAWGEALLIQIENLLGRLNALAAVLESLAKAINGEDADELEELRYILSGQQMASQAMADTLLLVLNLSDPKQVTWLEQNSRLYLKTAPIEIGDILQEKIFTRLDAVVLTSATLSIANSFEHFLRDIGLPLSTKTMQVDSPFDYERQMRFFVVRKGPDVQAASEEKVKELAEYISEVVIRMNGRTLVLFTAHSLLRGIYASLYPKLSRSGIETLAQGFHGERSAILEAFKRNPRSVLLGANSFWEGIDIPGESLSCVILIKLPFWPPSLPLMEARSEYFESLGRNPFHELSLPEAVIRFKQGFGRLIRSGGDRGIVILLDDRVLKKYYGRLFLNSLPVKTHIRGESALILRKVEEWSNIAWG